VGFMNNSGINLSLPSMKS